MKTRLWAKAKERLLGSFLSVVAVLGLLDQALGQAPPWHRFAAVGTLGALAIVPWFPSSGVLMAVSVVSVAILVDPTAISPWVPSVVVLVGFARVGRLAFMWVSLGVLFSGLLGLVALGDAPHSVRLALLASWSIPLAVATCVGLVWRRYRLEQRRASATIAELKVRVAEEETRVRHEFSQDLHDLIGHELAVISLGAALISEDSLDPEQASSLESVRRGAASAAASLSLLVQSVQEDRPMVEAKLFRDTLGLGDWLEDTFRSARIELVVGEIATCDLPQAKALGMYRILLECTTNVLKHADRSKPCRLSITQVDGSILVELTNGLSSTPASPSVGLAGMEARAALIGGDFVAGQVGDDMWAARIRVPLFGGFASSGRK